MQAISRWHALVDNFNTSALDFYGMVEEALKERQVPAITTARVRFREGGVGSANREYLRIRRGRVVFDIGAAPYGNSYFFSWWLVRLGPERPWLWLLMAMIGLGFWELLLLGSCSQMLAGSAVGRSGVGLNLFLLLLALVPVGIIGGGLAVRHGYVLDEDTVLATPVLGWLYAVLFNPLTYYRLDTALMFQEAVRRAVNEVLNRLLEAQGLRALAGDELKPTIRDLAR